MPPIVLDHTLADLYSQDGDASKLVAVFMFPTPRTSSSPSKYTYQSPLAPSTDQVAVERRRLHNQPLKMAFLAGNMPVVFLDLDVEKKGGSDHIEDAAEVFGQLHPSQRPNLSFVPSLDDIRLPPNAEVVVLSPVDRMSHLPHAVDPEHHYDLLSKRRLAYSGLPTPKTTIIDSLPQDDFPQSQLDDEVQRMMRPIYEQDFPFIIKVPQAVGGLGTFIIHTKAQREAATKVLQNELRQMLQAVNPLNRHLYPCCLVLQEFVPGETMGLTLFVTQRGRPIFNGCCTQAMDPRGFWGGGTMSYPRQPELEKRFAGLMDQIADVLHRRGYYGPAGVDIMIDKDGRALVIDFNVRVTGSYTLGCLRSHFQSRGLSEALLYSCNAYCSQQEFRQHFQKEMEEGSVILITWTSHFPDGSSLVMLCMAAADQNQLQGLATRIQSYVSMLQQERS